MVKLSVCITAYNHGKFIKQTLEGVVNQKIDFPIEIIVHDDASTDNTRVIIEEYSKSYPEIKTIYQEENQYSKGRKPLAAIVIPQCRGEYIAICEGDDYWTDPYKLQKQVDFLDANPDYVICYHNAAIVDENDNFISDSKLRDELKRDFSADELIKGVMILTLTMCFRNVIKEFPEEIRKVKNVDKFLTSILGNYGKGRYLSEIKDAVYRRHSTSVWSSLDTLSQEYYNGDTRAWLSRFYNRIGKSNYGGHFQIDAVNHFKRVLYQICTSKLRDENNLTYNILNNYLDIISQDELADLKAKVSSDNVLTDSNGILKKDTIENINQSIVNKNLLKIGDWSFIDEQEFNVDWILTRICNYKCNYCTVYDNENGSFVPIENLKNIIDQLCSLRHKKITLSLSGGEPTLHPGYSEFLDYSLEKLKDRLFIKTQTNLSKKIMFFERFVERFENYLDQFIFYTSFHFEFAEKESYFQKLRFLSENKVNVLFKICAEPDRMDEVKQIYQEALELENDYLSVVLVVVRENYGAYP